MSKHMRKTARDVFFVVVFLSLVGLSIGANFGWVLGLIIGGITILWRERWLEKKRQLADARNDNSAYWKGPTKK